MKHRATVWRVLTPGVYGWVYLTTLKAARNTARTSGGERIQGLRVYKEIKVSKLRKTK